MRRLNFSAIGTVIAGTFLAAACGDSTGTGTGGGSTTGTGGDATTTSTTTTSTTTTTTTTTTTSSAGGGGGGTGGAGVGGGGTGGGIPGWTCLDSFYGDGSDCDCGCGIQDTDCADLLVATCEFCTDGGSCSEFSNGCPGFINATNNAICIPSVAETGATLCADTIDNDQDGDVDCEDANCFGQTGCAPVGWTCQGSYYNDGADCDCGCGIADMDCSDALVATCDFCTDTGSCSENSAGCPGFINATNNAICIPAVAETGATLCADTLDNDQDGDTDCGDTDCYGQTGCPAVGWTCAASYYDTGDTTDCDCGCGVQDPDCTDLLVATCDYCADLGSCSVTSCPGTIHPTNNATCP